MGKPTVLPTDNLHEILSMLPPDRGLRIRNNAAWIRCPNPKHSGGHETTPSLKINLDGTGGHANLWHCFGCHTSGHWNTIAKLYDLPTLDENFHAVGQTKLGFKKRYAHTTESLGKFPWPTEREWRGIPGRIVSKVGGRVTDPQSALDEPKLILPVMQYGEEVGHISAMLGNPRRNKAGRKLDKSYINSDGVWSSTALFGFDIAAKPFFKHKPLWLVEGPRDVLYLLSLGVRVVGILGSNMTSEKAELIRMLNPPVILVGTDADDAGDSAAQGIVDHCGDFHTCVRVRWAPGEDPVDQTPEKILKLDARAVAKYCRPKKGDSR